MGIEMSGGVYCPLSPRDPAQRLSSLIQQTRTRLVLVHSSTSAKFSSTIVTLNIDSLLVNDNTFVQNEIGAETLSAIVVTPDDLSYVIFTSGSTGTPKAVSIDGASLDIDEMFALICFRLKCDIEISLSRCIHLFTRTHLMDMTQFFRWHVVHSTFICKISWEH